MKCKETTKKTQPSLPVVFFVLALFWSFSPILATAENWDHYRGWEVTSFEVTGIPEDIPSGFQVKLALHGYRSLFKIKRPPFKTILLAEDLARIRLHLAQQGYPQAKTFPTAELDFEARQMSLIIEIQPGKPVVIGQLALDGWPERVAYPDTGESGFLHEGRLFQDEVIQTAAKYLTSVLQDSGFESARVSPRLGSYFDGEVSLYFDVDAGTYSIIDSVKVVGCSDDLVPVALRVMDLDPGKEYSAEKMRLAALDLRGTQLFGHVEIGTENMEPGHLMAVAKLEDARMRAWRAGIGTWSDNPILGRLEWSHNNLFSHGIGSRVGGTFGTHEARLGAEVFWLGWLTPRSRTSFGLRVENEREDSYKSLEKRAELLQAFRPNLRDMWKIGTAISFVNVETYTPDPDEAPDAQGPLWELWSDWKWDRTDDPINPTLGYNIKISLTVAPPIGFTESPYVQAQFDGVRFYSLQKNIVLGGRIRAGGSHSLGDSGDLLANRRFYAGGFNTMRGYTRRQLGPMDNAGEPRGGKFVALAGVELRFPLLWLFNGALFFDSGQVWREASDISTDDYSGAVGMALDLSTPLGPLRLNYAANIVNRQADESREMWTFGIGYPW
ncbi:MAG: BamA/TamA family outer membrane protein [bacterium]|nr:BamA/TamA family outer membrane protein [bacterium]